MDRDKLVVTDGGRKEVCTVEETVETRGNVYARVEGDTLNGWVEVPDNPEEPTYAD